MTQDELARLADAWEALRQAIWENSPSYDPHEFIADHRPAIEAALRATVADTAGIDAACLAVTLRDWENARHPLPSPDADDGPHTWDAWIAEARKLLDAALVRTPETLDVERIFDALPTTEAEWRPFWHRVDDPDGWVVSIYGHKLAEYVVARLAGEPSDQP